MPSVTRTSSPTATRTATPSPSPPVCRGLPLVRLLTGVNGTAPPLSTAASGQPTMYTSGTCASGLRAFYPGARLLYALSLGSATPLGGTLMLTTCGHSANNTVLYVGTGCPSWAQPFGCIVGNDNAAAPACGSNGLASSVAVTVTQPVVYIQLGGHAGEPVTSGLAWAYAAPASRSASGTHSRTRSRSGSRTRSRSGSRSGSRSRSRKAK